MITRTPTNGNLSLEFLKMAVTRRFRLHCRTAAHHQANIGETCGYRINGVTGMLMLDLPYLRLKIFSWKLGHLNPSTVSGLYRYKVLNSLALCHHFNDLVILSTQNKLVCDKLEAIYATVHITVYRSSIKCLLFMPEIQLKRVCGMVKN